MPNYAAPIYLVSSSHQGVGPALNSFALTPDLVMTIINTTIRIDTDPDIGIYNISPHIQAEIDASKIVVGHVLITSQHTTTALAINEDEARLLEDIKTYLYKLAPRAERYLHNDLHLRDVPPGEPQNAHSHLMALVLSSSEMVPIIDGKLALGTYQSVLLFDLDGPRQRKVLLQINGDRQTN